MAPDSVPHPILLDLDGTLMDSASGILGTYSRMLQALGHTQDPAVDLGFTIGPALADAIPLVLAHYGDTRTDLAIATYRDLYNRSGIFDAAVYPGIPAMLSALRAAGHPLYLATAKREDAALRVLDRFGLAPHFTAVHGSVPDGSLDHKPELIASILARHGLDPAVTTMAGDRRYDITGAHANACRAIGVLWGYGTEAELTQAGADALARDPAHLLDLLL